MELNKYFKGTDLGKHDGAALAASLMNLLGPADFCPLAAHAIFPYVYGLGRGSWFRWEKTKTSVVAQCPNPDSCVAFRISRSSDGSNSAEVVSLKKACMAGYKKGDLIKLSQRPLRNPTCACCHMNRMDGLEVSVVSHSVLCRYYQEPGTLILAENMVPKDFCLAAYHAAYPYALTLLYDGAGEERTGSEESVLIPCPNSGEKIHMRIRTKRNLLSAAMGLAAKALRSVGMPKDILDKAIKIEVTNTEGACPKGLTAGYVTDFNLYNSKEPCPAVFYNIFPYMAMMNEGVYPYWKQDPRKTHVHCPDACADIVYQIAVKGRAD